MTDSPNPAETLHSPEQTILLHLPPDLAIAIRQRAAQLGQSPLQLMVTALRQVLATSEPTGSLEVRLAALEAIVPRLEQLEGKLMAF